MVDVFQFLRAVRDDRTVSPAARAVAAYGLALRRSDSGRCNPGIKTIAADAGYKDERTVEEAIRELEEKGYVSVVRMKGKSNSYELRLPTKNAGAFDAPTKNVPTKNADEYPQKMGVGYPQKMGVEETKEVTKEENITSPQLSLTPDEKPTPKRAESIPFAKVVEIYNQELGNALGMCQRLSTKRKSWIRQRWADVAEIVESKQPEIVLEGFQAYYQKVARSDFLMGRVENSSFRATFDWIHKESNFVKIFEDNYANYRRQKVQRAPAPYHHIHI